MIGNNRHSDRTFVSEHICGRLAPSAGHADARLLARPPVFTLAASLSRSLSISFLLSFLAYLLSFSTPVFFSLARPRPPYAVPSRSPLALVPPPVSPFPFVSARPPLLSRVVVPLSKPLFPPRYITTLPRLVSVLVEFAARSPLRHRAHLRILLARALHPFRRSVSVSIRSETALYFSLLFSPPSRLPFPSPSFSLSPCVFFLRPTLFRPTFMYRLASGMRDVHHTSARVRTCAPRPSFSRSSRAAGEPRVFESLRYAFMGKKKWADVSSALVTAACKYAAAEGARTRHACTGSVEELLPFLSASFLYRPGFSNIFARYPLRRGI